MYLSRGTEQQTTRNCKKNRKKCKIDPPYCPHLVGVPVSGIDAAVLVVELDSAGNGLGEGEAAGLGLNVLQLVPFVLGDVLGHEGVGGLDIGELSGHLDFERGPEH